MSDQSAKQDRATNLALSGSRCLNLPVSLAASPKPVGATGWTARASTNTSATSNCRASIYCSPSPSDHPYASTMLIEVEVITHGPDENNPKRWTAKRRAALVIDILRGSTPVVEAARNAWPSSTFH